MKRKSFFGLLCPTTGSKIPSKYKENALRAPPGATLGSPGGTEAFGNTCKIRGNALRALPVPHRALPEPHQALPEAQKPRKYQQNTRKTLAGLSRCHIGLSRRHRILRNRRFGSAGGTDSLEFACPSLPEAPSRSGSPIRLSRRLPESQRPEI